MKKRLLCLILPVITLILEILPYGAVLNFANPEGPPQRQTYSYFNPITYGYAYFTPLLTALVTCAVLAVLIIWCITGKRGMATAARTLLLIGTVLSFGFLLYGPDSVSAVAVLISVSLLAETAIFHIMRKVPPANF